MDRSDWREAHVALHDRDVGSLDLAELEDMAEACFWMCEPRYWLDARRRAYAIYRDAGDIEQAALISWHLFTGHFDLGETAVAGGWAGRAAQHGDQLPGTVAAGYAELAQGEWARFNGSLDAGLEHAARAIALGEANSDSDLVALGKATRGRFRVLSGDPAAGVSEMDEAMLSAAGGELSRFTTGRVYCLLVSTCHEMGDVRRAGEWTATAVRWCERLGEESWYPGLCRLHRCELDSLLGEWVRAEREARVAADELAPFGPYWVGEGLYLVGEIHRHRGDLADAEGAYAQAHEHGREPLPGMALVRAEKGDAAGAEKLLARSLDTGGYSPLRAAHMLDAHTTVALAAGHLDQAVESAVRLRDLADRARVPLLDALALRAQGATRLAAGETEESLGLLRRAAALLLDLSCPYEEGRARMLMGEALAAAGDAASAQLEFAAAASVFERLGARIDADRARNSMPGDNSLPNDLTAREAEVLALVARGKSNRMVAEELVLSEHTVARHLSNIFRKIHVTSRSAAAAFAFDHHLV